MFVRLLLRPANGHHAWVITFEQFVQGLGPHARRYTTAQLRQLHVDVRKMAQVLLAIHKSRRRQSPPPFPQPHLDGTNPDRTLTPSIMQHGDDITSSPADQP